MLKITICPPGPVLNEWNGRYDYRMRTRHQHVAAGVPKVHRYIEKEEEEMTKTSYWYNKNKKAGQGPDVKEGPPARLLYTYIQEETPLEIEFPEEFYTQLTAYYKWTRNGAIKLTIENVLEHFWKFKTDFPEQCKLILDIVKNAPVGGIYLRKIGGKINYQY